MFKVLNKDVGGSRIIRQPGIENKQTKKANKKKKQTRFAFACPKSFLFTGGRCKKEVPNQTKVNH